MTAEPLCEACPRCGGAANDVTDSRLASLGRRRRRRCRGCGQTWSTVEITLRQARELSRLRSTLATLLEALRRGTELLPDLSAEAEDADDEIGPRRRGRKPAAREARVSRRQGAAA